MSAYNHRFGTSCCWSRLDIAIGAAIGLNDFAISGSVPGVGVVRNSSSNMPRTYSSLAVRNLSKVHGNDIVSC